MARIYGRNRVEATFHVEGIASTLRESRLIRVEGTQENAEVGVYIEGTDMIPFEAARDRFSFAPDRLIIVGPPGTGKTRTALDYFLVEAIAEGVDPDEILCCSYSSAAANEIRERATRATNLEFKQLRATCSTIHSEALRRIKTVRQDWELYDPASGTARSLGKRNEVDSENDTEGGVDGGLTATAMRAWDYCRAMLIHEDPAEVNRVLYREVSSYRNKRRVGEAEILATIERHERAKREAENWIDFTDMLLLALRFGGRRLRLLLVDEAQDCSPLQWKLIDVWSRLAEKVVIIGDPDQAIHEWMGAAPELLVDRIRSDSWATRFLDHSYRVPGAVYDAARSIILRNRDRIDAPYEPADHEGEVRIVADVDEAAAAIEANPEDTFVLARSAKALGPIAETLTARGVPFKNERGATPWGSRVRMDIAFAIISLKERGWADAASLRRLVGEIPVRGADYFSRPRTKVIGAIKGDDETPVDLKDGVLRGEDGEAIEGFNIDALLDGDLLACLGRAKSTAPFARPIVAAYASGGIDAILEPPRVTLTTMHASKGREAGLVVVLAQMPFPAQTAYEGGQADAERRLLYVAATRARGTLLICGGPGKNYDDLLMAGNLANNTRAHASSTSTEKVPF